MTLYLPSFISYLVYLLQLIANAFTVFMGAVSSLQKLKASGIRYIQPGLSQRRGGSAAASSFSHV